MDTFLRSFPRMYTMASCPRPVSQVFLLDTITGHNLRRFGFKWTQFQVILGGSRIYFASHKVLFLDTLMCCFCTQSRVGPLTRRVLGRNGAGWASGALSCATHWPVPCGAESSSATHWPVPWCEQSAEPLNAVVRRWWPRWPTSPGHPHPDSETSHPKHLPQ